jgi:hypothetical protein
MVTLLVGDEPAVEVFLHKDFEYHYSPVLKAAFNSAFIEGQTQTYNLRDTNERAVRLLVHWFYTPKLDYDVSPGSASGSKFLSLFQLWVLADWLLVPLLQKMVMHEIQGLCACLRQTPTDCINYVYNSISPGSQPHRFILEECAYSVLSAWYMKYPKVFPEDMLIELASLFAESLKPQRREVFKDSKNS